MAARQLGFRRAADAIAVDLAKVPAVRAIALFGSLARPLVREVPRFQPFRRHGIEILHECGDIDLAVAIDRLDNLSALNRARSRAVNDLFERSGIGVAHHQVDIFLFGEGLSRSALYLRAMSQGKGRMPHARMRTRAVSETARRICARTRRTCRRAVRAVV
jgi:hypothetical protein